MDLTRISRNTDCDKGEQLDVENGNFTSKEENVRNLLTQDENEWRADESTTKDQGFMLRIRGGKRNVTGIRMQNAAQPWASKEVLVLGALEKTGPWINLVEAELEETTSTQTFIFGQPQVDSIALPFPYSLSSPRSSNFSSLSC